jgi:hypothetical protein
LRFEQAIIYIKIVSVDGIDSAQQDLVIGAVGDVLDSIVNSEFFLRGHLGLVT